MSSELSRLALLAKKFGKPATGVGIGDDAAVLEGGLVWTVDAQVDGTHFKMDWLTWQDVGWRSFMAAASDIAAMGAKPLAALSALVLPRSVTDENLSELADGQAAAAKAIGVPIVGGNLARGTEMSITTTLVGRAMTPVLRSGARPGDSIWLAGPVGLASTGLTALLRQTKGSEFAKCINAWRRPRARVELEVGGATGGIDISDGLARDAMHMANASKVTMALESANIKLPPKLDKDPLEYALYGGEDYALLMTSVRPLEGFVKIGTVEPMGDAAVTLDGAPIKTRGFDHFASTART